MGEFIDKTGKKFNMLTVKKYLGNRCWLYEFVYDFLRGMIDGDGCISFNEYSKTSYADLTLTTSSIMANKIKKWLDENCPYEDHFVLTHRRKENQDNATLISSNKSYIKNILNLLYGNAEMYMDRKYNKYLAFLGAFGL